LPPTAPNARTGLSTPPGSTWQARVKRRAELREGDAIGWPLHHTTGRRGRDPGRLR